MKFYDRKNELAILQDNEQQSFENAVFTVLMGRRRIGKTIYSEVIKFKELIEYEVTNGIKGKFYPYCS